MSDSQSERRVYTRLPKNYNVEVSALTFPMNSQPTLRAKSADISAGGMRVEVDGTFRMGDKVRLRVHIPFLNKFTPSFFKVYENDVDQYLEAIAEVVRIEHEYSYGSRTYGLKFLDLDSDSVAALKNMIDRAVRDS